MTLAPGHSLLTYRLIEKIGEGGMGVVWRAKDTSLDREVAIKVLPPEFAESPDRVARFKREAKAVAALSHPNILAIHDLGRDGEHVFAVMELLTGETLRERLASESLPSRKIQDWGRQIALGLAAAHGQGIVHRDVKPANIFITSDGTIKILDFGLAKSNAPISPADETAAATKGLTEPGMVLGTMGYMSPEQVRGQPADHRSDIFSLGAVLYEMLTGQRAFSRDTSAETMTAVLREEPPEISQSGAGQLAGLAPIIGRCLEKRRDERFQSARDLAFAIESITRDTGSHAPAEAEDIGVEEPAPQRRWLAPAVAVLLIAIAAAIGYQLGRQTDTVPGSGAAAMIDYQRLTFRRGAVYTARFDPQGRQVVYSAGWEGNMPRVYSTLPGSRASIDLEMSAADVLDLSPSGQMALLVRSEQLDWEDFTPGTLAVASASGGAIRAVQEGVLLAEWMPDGEQLVVVRVDGRILKVEYPAGTVVYETPHVIDSMRLSPQGDLIAFGEKPWGFGDSWRIVFLKPDGEQESFDTGLRGDWIDVAWSPTGDEVWFNMNLGASTDIHAMDRSGSMRLLASPPIALRILDASPDGRVLVARTTNRFSVRGLPPGETRERDYSWLDSSELDSVSADGRTLLMTEFGEGGGFNTWSVFLRRTDGSPAVRLGEGQAFQLSPDGKWASSLPLRSPPRLTLLPTGAGTPIELPPGPVEDVLTAVWTADGRHVVFMGVEAGRGPRFYRQSIDGGDPQPITQPVRAMGVGDALGSNPLSPDGRSIAAHMDDLRVAIFPTDGGDPRPIPDLEPGLPVVSWSPDGTAVYVRKNVDRSSRLLRVDPQSGATELVREIESQDPAGIQTIYATHLLDDGASYFYTMQEMFSDLYLVEGWR